VHDDELLLSTFVHEELHWFVADRKQSDAAIKELRRRRDIGSVVAKYKLNPAASP
jgi:hypothetical protein